MCSSNSAAKYRIPVSSGLEACCLQAAEGRVAHVAGEVAQQLRCPSGRAWPSQKALTQLGQTARADAAGDGLAAGLVGEVARHAGWPGPRGSVESSTASSVPEPTRAPAAARASAGNGVSSASGRQEAARRARPRGRPSAVAAARSRPRTVDDSRAGWRPAGPRRCPAGARRRPAGRASCPGRVGRTEGGVGARAVAHDPGHGGQRLDVVDDGRACPTGPAARGTADAARAARGGPRGHAAGRSPRPRRSDPSAARTSMWRRRGRCPRAPAPM